MAELSQISKAAGQQLQVARAELKNSQLDREELDRLRKNAQELARLRNEIAMLRNSTKPISAQQWERLLAQNSQLQRERDGLIAEREHAPRLSCINNLRIIQGAKKQWAADTAQADSAMPTAEQIAPYLPSPFPVCPADGLYDFKTVRDFPTCSITNHVLTAENL
jgi:hypothetical protein